MKVLIRAILALLLAGALVAPAGAAGLRQVWRTTGFDAPESVAFDSQSYSFFVSNVGGSPGAKDGNGFISELDSSGAMMKRKWVTGLNAPKGVAVFQGRLYVADLDTLIVIDIATAQILDRYPAKGAKFLNDVAVAQDGRVYVSDTATDSIYVLEYGDFSLWLKSPELDGPNGLLALNDSLLVADFGDGATRKGNVKSVEMFGKTISNFDDGKPVGGLDGIQPAADGKSFTVTDNTGGRLLEVRSGEPARLIAKLKPGAADHAYVPLLDLIVVPQMADNAVVAYRRD